MEVECEGKVEELFCVEVEGEGELELFCIKITLVLFLHGLHA